MKRDHITEEIPLAGKLDNWVRQYNRSTKAVSQDAAVKREIAAAKQVLDRANMLYCNISIILSSLHPAGSVTETVSDRPSRLEALTSPLWASTTAWTMERPMPCPPVWEFREGSAR